MKAFIISEYAHPSKIPLSHDAPEPFPTPDSDQLLIDVYSAGLNFFDVRLYPLNLPLLPPAP
jgi:NADPH:quinone reductase